MPFQARSHGTRRPRPHSPALRRAIAAANVGLPLHVHPPFLMRRGTAKTSNCTYACLDPAACTTPAKKATSGVVYFVRDQRKRMLGITGRWQDVNERFAVYFFNLFLYSVAHSIGSYIPSFDHFTKTIQFLKETAVSARATSACCMTTLSILNV